MELGFDRKLGREALARGLSGDGHPEWRALLARLSASYAARLEIEQSGVYAPPAFGGSFDRGSARIMHHYGANPEQGLGLVNRTDLGGGKASDGITDHVAGRQMSDDRG